MKRKVFAIFCVCLMTFSLVACGKTTSADPSSDDAAQVAEIEKTTSEVTIKPEETTKLVVEETKPQEDKPVVQNQLSYTVVEPTENPANVDNSGHEPDSYQSGNFQDYWEGDDFFDIASFAEANGATYTMWCTGDGKAADASQANACKFFFKDKWKVIVNVDFIIIEQDGSDASFLVVYEQNSSESISVCKENNVKCSENVIQAFNTIVECLKTSSDKANPFEGSGLPCY